MPTYHTRVFYQAGQPRWVAAPGTCSSDSGTWAPPGRGRWHIYRSRADQGLAFLRRLICVEAAEWSFWNCKVYTYMFIKPNKHKGNFKIGFYIQWWLVNPGTFVPGRNFRINEFSGLLNRPTVQKRKSVPAPFVRISEIYGLSEPGLTNHHCTCRCALICMKTNWEFDRWPLWQVLLYTAALVMLV